MKKLDGFQIKVIMLCLMVLDHLPIIPGLVPPMAQGVIHLLTRCVAPWFAFIAVEGFLHTRNSIRYNQRLFFWAFFMEAGNLILNLCYQSSGVGVYNDIFITLAFGILVLNLLFYQKPTGGPSKENHAAGRNFALNASPVSGSRKKVFLFIRWLLALLALAAGMMIGEGGMILLPFMLITYFLRNKPQLRNVCYLLLSVLVFLTSFEVYPNDPQMTVQMLLLNSNWAFPLVIPWLYSYNGERGRNSRFAKYFFYIFYPAHLWLLATIGFFMAR